MRFEIYARRGLRGRFWYWRLKGRNGEVIAQSEGYRNRVDAVATASLIKGSAHEAPIRMLSDGD